MLKLTVILSLMFVASSVQAQSSDSSPENYLVINGISHHFSAAHDVMGKWNEANTGFSYQRAYSSQSYRHIAELGFFKDSYGKYAPYLVGSILRNVYDSPRVSIGGMFGVAYRTNMVTDIYYRTHAGPFVKNHPHILLYDDKQLTPIAGLVLQVAIPSTPVVLQTTFAPKVKANSSSIVFGQILVRF